MTTVELLKAARERVAKGWCQGWFAKDAAGEETLEELGDACAWCVRGAIYASAKHGEPESVSAEMALHDTLKDSGAALSVVGPLEEWNDAPGRTQAEVLDLFDRTIARLTEKP